VADASDWRHRRWEVTHRRIFASALGLFQDFGFEQVGVGQIASHAGVSVPTFYAHYPSKEHLIMAPPTPEEVQALVAGQPADIPVGERVRRATTGYIAQMPPEESEVMLARWQVIAGTPALRTRAAEFERLTAEMLLRSLPTPEGSAPGPAEVVQVGAYFSAFTAALLSWADSGGTRKLDETLDEHFGALDG
jgi:AcrR family transcriptional regulator